MISTPLHATDPVPSLHHYLDKVYKRQNFNSKDEFETIKHKLQEAYAHPLDLHKVSKEQLSTLGVLSEPQLEAYWRHIKQTGPLYSNI